jgi:hypothetical protein
MLLCRHFERLKRWQSALLDALRENLYYGEFFETAEPLAGLALKKAS